MRQLIYIVLLLTGFQAAASTSDDSASIATHRTINGGTLKKQMGDRVYMKTNSPYILAIKCVKNPRVVCAYVASATEEEGDPFMCPSASSTFIPEPYYSMQFDPEKTYLGIPGAQGGVKYYELNSATFDCSDSDGDDGSVLITIDPPLDLEGE